MSEIDDLRVEVARLRDVAEHYLTLHQLAEERTAQVIRQRDELLPWARRWLEMFSQFSEATDLGDDASHSGTADEVRRAAEFLARIEAGAFSVPRIRPQQAGAQRNLRDLVEVTMFEDTNEALEERGLATDEERRRWWRSPNRRLGRRTPDEEFRAGYRQVVLDAAREFVERDFEV